MSELATTWEFFFKEFLNSDCSQTYIFPPNFSSWHENPASSRWRTSPSGDSAFTLNSTCLKFISICSSHAGCPPSSTHHLPTSLAHRLVVRVKAVNMWTCLAQGLAKFRFQEIFAIFTIASLISLSDITEPGTQAKILKVITHFIICGKSHLVLHNQITSRLASACLFSSHCHHSLHHELCSRRTQIFESWVFFFFCLFSLSIVKSPLPLVIFFFFFPYLIYFLLFLYTQLCIFSFLSILSVILMPVLGFNSVLCGPVFHIASHSGLCKFQGLIHLCFLSTQQSVYSTWCIVCIQWILVELNCWFIFFIIF